MANWIARVNGHQVGTISSRGEYSIDRIVADSEYEAKLKAIEIAKETKNIDDVYVVQIRKKS